MVTYITILPLRFYDYYKLRKQEEEKKRNKYEMSNVILTTAKDMMTSKFDEQSMNEKIDEDFSNISKTDQKNSDYIKNYNEACMFAFYHFKSY